MCGFVIFLLLSQIRYKMKSQNVLTGLKKRRQPSRCQITNANLCLYTYVAAQIDLV
jgi:hypothetical protein